MLSVKRFAIESAKTGGCQGITEAGQGISENKRGFSLEGIWPPPWGVSGPWITSITRD